MYHISKYDDLSVHLWRERWEGFHGDETPLTLFPTQWNPNETPIERVWVSSSYVLSTLIGHLGVVHK